jgi:hypothetical protein
MSRVDPFDPIPPPPPPPTVRGSRGGNELLQKLFDALEAHEINAWRFEVNARRSWWGAFKAWLRGVP